MTQQELIDKITAALQTDSNVILLLRAQIIGSLTYMDAASLQQIANQLGIV